MPSKRATAPGGPSERRCGGGCRTLPGAPRRSGLPWETSRFAVAERNGVVTRVLRPRWPSMRPWLCGRGGSVFRCVRPHRGSKGRLRHRARCPVALPLLPGLASCGPGVGRGRAAARECYGVEHEVARVERGRMCACFPISSAQPLSHGARIEPREAGRSPGYSSRGHRRAVVHNRPGGSADAEKTADGEIGVKHRVRYSISGSSRASALWSASSQGARSFHGSRSWLAQRAIRSPRSGERLR